MFKIIALLIAVFLIDCQSSPVQSDYRKYLRTKSPQAPGELHVEEVLEVFKTRSRPSAYGVYHPQINAFLANDRFMRRKGSTVSPTTSPRPQLTTVSVPQLDRSPRTTHPTPSGDNVNPDYTFPFKPAITITRYPNYARPAATTTTIIIQEASYEWTTEKAKTTTMTTPENGIEDEPNLEEEDDYQYSDEDYDF
ncbi:uncharacterized protein LOC128744170 [Sabethes cyaneus]|uniref:uncharacterized protein LOC128744170 n=1 Tax=Sabethes cyaneus TaxID=53552 RepID=UPI00237D6336|nr:uncharacterized protein LOC128744170 [Sabethes cyaneus]